MEHRKLASKRGEDGHRKPLPTFFRGPGSSHSASHQPQLPSGFPATCRRLRLPSLGHALSAARAASSVFPSPTLGGPPLCTKPRPPLAPPLRGWLSDGPAHSCPAQLARGPRQGAQCTPPAAGGRVSPTPLLPRRRQFPARYASAPGLRGRAGPTPEGAGGSPMAAAGSRRPSV